MDAQQGAFSTPRHSHCSQNDGLHSLLRPRSWWHAKFEAAGAKVNEPLLWALQVRPARGGPRADVARAIRILPPNHLTASLLPPLSFLLQEKETRYSRARGDFRHCRMEGEAGDGGKFEVCVVNSVRNEALPAWAAAGAMRMNVAPSTCGLALLSLPSNSADLARGAPGPGGAHRAVHHARQPGHRALDVCVHGGQMMLLRLAPAAASVCVATCHVHPIFLRSYPCIFRIC